MILRILILLILASPLLTRAQSYFTDITAESGIEHAHIAPNLMGGGIAVIDYNNDGWEDLYLTGGVYEDKMFKNNGDGSFTSVGHSLGIYDITRVTQTTAVTTGDIDNDGWEDIFVSTEAGQQNILWYNINGTGFENISTSGGINDKSWSMGAAMADVNLDGLLDIYAINYIDDANPILGNDGSIIGFDHDCYPNVLYINNGDNTFEEKSAEYGVDSKGCGLAVTITDINDDHKPDIFIANDFGEWIVPNQYFENKFPLQSFEDDGEELNLNTKLFGMGISSGDINSDGLLDYYITNLGKNAMLEQNSTGGFENTTDYASVGNEKAGEYNSTGWGTQIFDVDHDGKEDLFVSNGYIGAAPFLQTTFDDPNKLFINDGSGKFTDVSDNMGLSDMSISRGTATFDYDNDGDLDLVTANISIVSTVDTNVKLYENIIGNTKNWLKVKLEGITSNKLGYGAKIKAYSNYQSFVKEVFGGGSHASKSSSVVHFGINDITELDSLVIYWPGGREQRFINIKSNQFIEIEEGIGQIGIIGCMDVDNAKYNQNATINSGCLAESTITSLEKYYDTDHIQVYPNPISKKFKVSGDVTFPLEVEVINFNGKLVINTVLVNSDQSVDISNLPSGIYSIFLNKSQLIKISKIN